MPSPATRSSSSRRFQARPPAAASVPDIVSRTEIAFDTASRSLRARRLRLLGAVRLAEEPVTAPATAEAAEILAGGILGLGAGTLPWTREQLSLRARSSYLRRVAGGDWPELSDAALAADAAWLAPAIVGRTALAAITADDLAAALDALLPWERRAEMDRQLPSHLSVPTGSRIAIDYDAEGGPAVSVRVQELFGLDTHPSIAGGRVPLTLVLLSPAHRPIQTTKDLPGFWRGSWKDVARDLRGRYPRHPWPDDPRAAAPTTRAKPRGT